MFFFYFLGSTPTSSQFDITLMISLFRHLSTITPLSGDFDTLPPPSDETLGADLARIKYYRNNIAHCLEDNRKMSDLEFQFGNQFARLFIFLLHIVVFFLIVRMESIMSM